MKYVIIFCLLAVLNGSYIAYDLVMTKVHCESVIADVGVNQEKVLQALKDTPECKKLKGIAKIAGVIMN